MANKDIRVTRESETGRNERFQIGSRNIPRGELVKEIKSGQHPGYHIRKINGVDTPVSNPDRSEANNLD